MISSLETADEFDEARHAELREEADQGIAGLDAGLSRRIAVDDLGGHLPWRPPVRETPSGDRTRRRQERVAYELIDLLARPVLVEFGDDSSIKVSAGSLSEEERDEC